MRQRFRRFIHTVSQLPRRQVYSAAAIGATLLLVSSALLAAALVRPHHDRPAERHATKPVSAPAGKVSDTESASSGSAIAPTASSGAGSTPQSVHPLPPAPSPPPPVTPATVLDLANWRLALPIDTAHAGDPDEINQPELAGFTSPPYFMLTPAKDGVIFQAHAGGATTKNSSYPRSELREMTAGGTARASWSNTTGTHTMVVRQAITHLPAAKPEVVAAQIHDASDDVIMVKLSGTRLFVEADSDPIGDLDTNYTVGTIYTVRIVASTGRIRVYFNDILKVDYTKSGSGFYFKAGCYTQSNVSKGDAPDAYAQVIIYGLQVSHS